MLFVFLIAPAAAQCQGCESSCFTDCSNKYKMEIIDPDALPGGGGFAGNLMQTDGEFKKVQSEMEREYLECMDTHDQCRVPKLLQKLQNKKRGSLVGPALNAQQKHYSNTCLMQIKKQTVAAKAAHKATKRLKHAKKFLRHVRKAASLLEEEEANSPPANPLEKVHYLDSGAFAKGSITLAQCLDVCISAHCPCPSPFQDGTNFADRYPAISESAAEAAGVPSQADVQAQADANQQIAADLTTVGPTTTTTTTTGGWTTTSPSGATTTPSATEGTITTTTTAPAASGAGCDACLNCVMMGDCDYSQPYPPAKECGGDPDCTWDNCNWDAVDAFFFFCLDAAGGR